MFFRAGSFKMMARAAVMGQVRSGDTARGQEEFIKVLEFALGPRRDKDLWSVCRALGEITRKAAASSRYRSQTDVLTAAMGAKTRGKPSLTAIQCIGSLTRNEDPAIAWAGKFLQAWAVEKSRPRARELYDAARSGGEEHWVQCVGELYTATCAVLARLRTFQVR